MSKIYIFIVITLIPIPVLSQKLYDRGYHNTIVNVHPLNADSILISSNGGDFHVSIFSLNQNRILEKLIRNGRGPSEAIQIESSTVEFTDVGNYLYVKESGGGIIKYDVNRQSVLKEALTRITNVTNMQVYKNELVLSKRLVIFPQQLSEYDLLDVGYVLEKSDFKIKDTLRLPIQYLELDNLRNINRLERETYIGLNTFLIKFNNNNYLLAINGVNKVFYFSKGMVENVIDLKIPNSFDIEVMKHKMYGYGIRFPGIINNVSSLNIQDQEVTFSFGNLVLGIPYGLVTVFKDVKGFQTSYYYFDINDTSNLSSNAMVTKIKSDYLIYDSMRISTSNLYFYK